MLKLSYTKVVDQHMLDMIKVLNFRALSLEQVPAAYLNTFPNCYTTPEKDVLVINMNERNSFYLKKEQLITPEALESLTSTLANCGHNLYKINKYIRKRRAQWETVKPRAIKF
jgi:hypothetical protein